MTPKSLKLIIETRLTAKLPERIELKRNGTVYAYAVRVRGNSYSYYERGTLMFTVAVRNGAIVSLPKAA
jgi:hypothetical protein